MYTNRPKNIRKLPEDISELKELASYRIPMKVTEMVAFCSKNDCYSGYYICPRCKISMEREFMAYCDRCGQKLDWRGYKKARLINNSKK